GLGPFLRLRVVALGDLRPREFLISRLEGLARRLAKYGVRPHASVDADGKLAARFALLVFQEPFLAVDLAADNEPHRRIAVLGDGAAGDFFQVRQAGNLPHEAAVAVLCAVESAADDVHLVAGDVETADEGLNDRLNEVAGAIEVGVALSPRLVRHEAERAIH